MTYTVADQMIEVLVQAGSPQGLTGWRRQPEPVGRRDPPQPAIEWVHVHNEGLPRWQPPRRPSSPGSSRCAPGAAAPVTPTSSRALRRA